MANTRAVVQPLWSIDTRTLACFRFLLALFVLFQVGNHSVFGVLTEVQSPGLWSVPGIRLTGVVLTLFSLLTFALGYKARISALVLWLGYSLLTVGVNSTNLEPLVSVLLLFGVFLPLARNASFDDAMDRGCEQDGKLSSEPVAVTSHATVAVKLFGFGVVCLFALVAILSTDRFLHVSVFAVPILLGVTLLPPNLVKARFWTVTLLIVLLVVSALFWSPDGDSQLRELLSAVLVSLFLPADGWTSIGKHPAFQSRHDLRIYYDEPCGFCRKICFIFASFMLLGRCSIATAQSDEQAHKLLTENDSWVVFDQQGNVALCWAAVLVLLRESPVWRPLGYALTAIGMGTWGKPIYRLIGKIRGGLSAVTARLLPYTRYRVELFGFEKAFVTVWCVTLLMHYLGVFGAFNVKLPAFVSMFGL